MSSRGSLSTLTSSIRRRLTSGTSDYDYFDNEQSLELGRPRSITRRKIVSNIPLVLFRPNAQDQLTSTAVHPNVFIYDQDTCEEPVFTTISNLRFTDNCQCVWIDVPCVHNKALLTSIAERFKIHPLVIEDIEKPVQRTKLDVFDDALFLVVKLIFVDPLTKRTEIEQMSFYLQKNVLITFQEKPKEMFDSVKTRIRSNRGRIRRSKIDYLFYLLLDTIVDQYMDLFNNVNIRVEAIEAKLMKDLSRDTLETIYDLKREMLFYRGMIFPLKEIINRLQKDEETQIIQDETLIYFKDLFDHVVQVNDTIDTYREMLASFIDFYMMLNSNAMDEVMKTLTIISTIFIPLTFIAGVYGMNFDNMPEIHWEYGYFIVLTCMALLTLVMLIFFKIKKWY